MPEAPLAVPYLSSVKWLCGGYTCQLSLSSIHWGGCCYLEERDLVLEGRIRCIDVFCLQREVVEQMPAPEIRLGLGDELGSFHVLSMPERCAILDIISFQFLRAWNTTYNCDPNPLCIIGSGRVLVVRRNTEVLIRRCIPVNIPLPSANWVRKRPFSYVSTKSTATPEGHLHFSMSATVAEALNRPLHRTSPASTTMGRETSHARERILVS